MTRWTVLLIVALLVALVGGGYAARRADRAEGEARAWQDSAQARHGASSATAATFRADTVRLRSVLTRWDTARVVDTVTRVDTVTGERIVYVARAQADTAIKACTMAVVSCGAALAAQKAESEAWRQASVKWEAVASARSGRIWGVPLPVVTVGGCAMLDGGTVRVGPCASVGWRVTW